MTDCQHTFLSIHIKTVTGGITRSSNIDLLEDSTYRHKRIDTQTSRPLHFQAAMTTNDHTTNYICTSVDDILYILNYIVVSHLNISLASILRSIAFPIEYRVIPSITIEALSTHVFTLSIVLQVSSGATIRSTSSIFVG